MKLLLDTHILLWMVRDSSQLPGAARRLIGNEDNSLVFSVASLWEIAIKSGLGRSDFNIDSRALRRVLLDEGHEELIMTGEHAVAICGLPPIHNDPFDRLLVAQAMVEGITLLTADRKISEYPGPIRWV
jgi:PIN domain nuclease of toxin-antitoxin system